MLKVLSYSCRLQNVLSSHSIPSAITRNYSDSTTPLLKVLNSLRRCNRFNSNLYHRAFFCSDSSSKDDDSAADGGAAAKSAAGEGEDADSKSSNAILPSVFRPDECFTSEERMML
ncbi:Lon protease-like protein mitochondrial [Bienertia sinuspersici]